MPSIKAETKKICKKPVSLFTLFCEKLLFLDFWVSTSNIVNINRYTPHKQQLLGVLSVLSVKRDPVTTDIRTPAEMKLVSPAGKAQLRQVPTQRRGPSKKGGGRKVGGKLCRFSILWWENSYQLLVSVFSKCKVSEERKNWDREWESCQGRADRQVLGHGLRCWQEWVTPWIPFI